MHILHNFWQCKSLIITEDLSQKVAESHKSLYHPQCEKHLALINLKPTPSNCVLRANLKNSYIESFIVCAINSRETLLSVLHKLVFVTIFKSSAVRHNILLSCFFESLYFKQLFLSCRYNFIHITLKKYSPYFCRVFQRVCNFCAHI